MTSRVNELKWMCFRLCALALVASGCEESEKREPLPDWSDGYPDASAGLGQPSSAFSIALAQSVEYDARLGRRDAITSPCAISRSEAPAMLECIADINELDLWALGFAYDIHVPDGMCDFILHVPYMFANFAIGEGPKNVSYTVNADGTFSDEVNAMNGKPYCEYNHSFGDTQAPNCCFGTYTLAITSAATGKKTMTVGNWGGRRGDCYYGAAFVEADVAKDVDGVPMARYIYTHRDDHTELIDFKGVSDKFPANIAHANYFAPEDHGGAMPEALAAPGAHPYYDAYCLDDAEEIVAHLRLSVREWNEENEFDRMGNPDTVGEEGDFSEGPYGIDDIFDWKALNSGSGAFPGIHVANK